MPFRHVALLRWSDEVDEHHIEKFDDAISELAELSGVVRVTHGPGAGAGSVGSFDHVVVIDVDNESNWRSVREHPTYILFREEHVTRFVVDEAASGFRVADPAAVEAPDVDVTELSDDELLDRARRAARTSMDALLAEPDDPLRY